MVTGLKLCMFVVALCVLQHESSKKLKATTVGLIMYLGSKHYTVFVPVSAADSFLWLGSRSSWESTADTSMCSIHNVAVLSLLLSTLKLLADQLRSM